MLIGSVSFLEALTDSQRSMFVEVARSVPLKRGRHLIRRGEPGGDVFVLESGSLEVLDSRSSPELILSTLSPGALIGEMAFIDGSPRSVDVRASSDSVVLRWPRDELRALLEREPALAAIFYENVARLAASRVRYLTEGAFAGLFGRDTPPLPGGEALVSWVSRIVDGLKFAIPPAERRLRRDPDDQDAIAAVQQALDQLEREIEALFEATRDRDARAHATDILARELHPYLVRSTLAERSIRRPQATVASAEVLSHILVDTAGGDGRLGEVIDRWLLDRPTFYALRALKEPTIASVRERLPTHRNRRVTLVNVATGSIAAALLETLGQLPTVLTLVDSTTDAHALVASGPETRGVDLVVRAEDLPKLVSGRAMLDLPPQDVVILQSLAEYLPDRMVVSLLRSVRNRLSEGGHVVLATLSPSPDRLLLDRLLAWPTLRRSREALGLLAEAAGLSIASDAGLRPPAMLLILARR